jgi:myo-inositol-1(or 4)-monophosphatase
MISQRMAGTSALINVMILAAEKAGKGLIRDFGEIEHLQVSRKSLGDFVSTADRRSESVLIQELSKARPKFSFLVEESGEIINEDTQNRWIIDPLDGTTNFLHGVPHFAISIALESHGEIVAGLIFNPVTDELYWAEKGKGAFLNQRRLRVSGRRHLDEALLATGTPFGSRGDAKRFVNLIEKIMPVTAGLRRFGAAALDLAFVAAGRFEGYFEMDLQPWDLAAGIIMIKEAGGYICDFNGDKEFLSTGDVIAANEPVFLELKKLICPRVPKIEN